MPTVRATRATGVLLCAAALLPGCAGPRVAEQPPPGVNLAGSWKLDHAASDDPQKILEHMRAQAMKIIGHPAQPVLNMPPRGGRQGRPGQGGEMQEQSQDTGADVFTPAATPGPHFDPLQHSPMAHIIMDTEARGDFLTVRQSPGEFVLDYGGSRRSFTPGQHSVVSAEGGVVDQTSGWKGREYLIAVQPQAGPKVTESYGLSPDGKQLIETLHIGQAELPAVTLKRVYRPTDESAPHQLPTND